MAPVLLAVGFYAVLAFVAGRSDGFTYTRIIRPGAYFAQPGELLPGQRPEADYGYDGQFYFYLAEDPLLRRPATVKSLDGSFRYRRILYPALAWLLAGGSRSQVPRALFALNVAAAFLTVALVARAARAAKVSSWIAFLVAVFPGIWVPVVLDTTETLQTALATAAIVTGSLVLATFACLAKETGAVILVAQVADRWRRRGLYGALLPAAALALYVGWALAVRFVVLPGVIGWGGPSDLLVDFSNRHGDLVYMATHGSLASRVLPTAVALVFGIAILRLRLTRDLPTLAAAPYAAVVLALGVDTWIDALEYLRYAGFILVLLLLSWIQVRDRLGTAALLVAAAVSAVGVIAVTGLLAG